MNTTRLPSIAILAALSVFSAALSCGGKNTNKGVPFSNNPSGQVTDDDRVLLQLENMEDGLTILLSEGSEGRQSSTARKTAAAAILSEAKAKQLLARMPSLIEKKGDKTGFAFRERSAPPPQTATKVSHQFPPPPSAALAPSVGGKLEVTRFSPEGKVPLAPQLSVSFSQPMVAITSHDDSIKNLPVKISPQPPGKWRWIGTKTLLFDPDVRFPMATKYDVEVAKGIKSANGESLSEDRSFSFSTPPLQLKSQYPAGGVHGLNPIIFVAFDQRVESAALLPYMKLLSKSKAVPLRMATAEEIENDKIVKGLVTAAKKRANGTRWLVVTPKVALAKESRVVVSVAAGAPSAEGPLLTTSIQSFHFETYGPLTLVKSRCGWRDCSPGTEFSFEFSNPLDSEIFDSADITVSPELPGQNSYVQGNRLSVRGRSVGRMSYTVTIPATLTDTFGQTLGKKEERTFRVDDARPNLFGASGLTIADPSAKTPSFDVHSTNVRSLNVQVYKVTPKDWEAHLLFMRSNPRRPMPAPGKKVVDKVVVVSGKANRVIDTAIDLTPAMNSQGQGHAVVVVKPVSWPDRYRPEIKSWVQVTDIGLDAFMDSEELIVWTSDLASGKALSGLDVQITHSNRTASTDKSGLATLDLATKQAAKGQHQVILATKGTDTAILPQGVYAWSDRSSFKSHVQADRLQWFTFDDRGMYKPSETVSVKGWVRKFQGREGGDIEGVRSSASVSYKVVGPRGNEMAKGKTQLNRFGGFDLKFKLPKTPNLGSARVEFQVSGLGTQGERYSHRFQIQEFRRPEFEVKSSASQGPHIVGKGADVTIDAKYYSGGPLAGADVRWGVRSTATSYTPPNQSDYSFGSWVPWWGYSRWDTGVAAKSAKRLQFEGKTDASGKHRLHMDFVSVKPPGPMSVIAEGRVQDVNRQSWSTSTTLLVHPSELYVGLKRDRYFVEKGQPIKVEGVVVSQEGAIATNRPATVRAVRMDWEYVKGEYKQLEKDAQVCAITSTEAPFNCEFKTPVGGTYKVTATVVDDKGRPNQTQITTWVSGGQRPPERNVVQEEVTLVPDKKEYQGGDTASILVQAPFFPADGVVTIRRSGIETTESFHMKTGTHTIKVNIRDGHVPNLTVQVDLVGSAERVDDKGNRQPTLPRRPAYAVGRLNIDVPPTKRTLKVRVLPKAKKLSPGSNSSVSVQVFDASGKPAADAEVVLMVVDEAVLALSSYKTPDPITSFYNKRSPGGQDFHQRQWLKLAKPDAAMFEGLANNQTGPGGGGFGGVGGEMNDSAMAPEPEAAEMTKSAPRKRPRSMSPAANTLAQSAQATPIAVRSNFSALAAFSPSVKTDAQGRATLPVRIPDNLTRYRVMAIAAAGKNHFGKGESSITARMPLMVRPSPPRFLNFGDKFELPVVVQNQTDQAMKVEVAVRATNASLPKGQGRVVSVPANDRVEVRFPTEAEMAGTARFQVAVSSGQFQDANEFSLPVWTPATTEAFATYGEIDKGAIKQPVRMPPNVVRSFGGLEVSMASTQLQSLTDAFLYLLQYPYECTEQTSSRIMGVAALRDVLTAFKSKEMQSESEIVSAVQRDIKRLSALQNRDGGFAFWIRGHESWPYISIYAAHALTEAKAKGFKVPDSLLNKSRDYLKNIERHIRPYYSISTRRMLIAYSLYVRKKMGESVSVRANKLIDEAGLKKLSMESLGWLMSVLHGDNSAKSRTQLKLLHRHLGNKVSETAATANWVDGYSDDAHLVLYSSRRADGVILASLIEDKPKSALIAKVVRGLLAHRKKGRWGNTQENSFVLLALDTYFQAYEKVTPNFVAQMWLGKNFAGEQDFRGRSTDEHSTDIPMSVLAKSPGNQDLVINKKGKGRLYYRIGMTYAPSDLKLESADHGFAVERSYEGVDNASDVVRLADGSWQIKAGTRVRVRLTMVAENRRYHVALVDPLPAGLEPLNPSLAVTGSIPQDAGSANTSRGRYWWWNRTWYEHQNMRDERVEAFTPLLWAGVHKYSYVTTATTPGRFVVPPTKAEEMYFPETFGRSASDIVVVK